MECDAVGKEIVREEVEVEKGETIDDINSGKS